MKSFSALFLALAAFLPSKVIAKDPEGLLTCLEDGDIPHIQTDSEDWLEGIEPFNLRVPVTPLAVVLATSVEHVQEAVICAAEHGIKVAARSGGHSYASFGLGGNDGQLVIQLDHMYGATLREDNVAVVLAGTRLGVVTETLFEQGRRGFSHGTCPSVGVGGHVTHGGFGFSSHTHGLALDWLVGARVVLADGSLVYANEKQNTDLFWALRGAGSSFGIAVEFEFETFPLPEELTWFSIVSNVTSGTKAEAVAGLLAFQEVLESGGIDPNLNMRLSLGSGRTQTLEVVYHGVESAAREALEVLNKPLKLDWKSRNTRTTSGDWLEHMEGWAYGDPLNITYPYEGRQNAYTSSLVTASISEEAMTSFVDYWYENAMGFGVPNWWAQMDVYGDPNSGVVATPSWATSYAHRDKLWLFQLSTTFFGSANTTSGINFLNEFMDSLKDPMAPGDWGRYANYIDSELENAEAVTQYYGAHLERLRGIKTNLDPTDLFHNPQSIRPWNNTGH